MIRGGGKKASAAFSTTDDYMFSEGLLMAFYHMNEDEIGRLTEQKFEALLERLPHVERYTALGRLERKI